MPDPGLIIGFALIALGVPAFLWLWLSNRSIKSKWEMYAEMRLATMKYNEAQIHYIEDQRQKRAAEGR